MHPARKFSQNLCKNKTLSIQSTMNKENDKNSLTESFAKKFSVGNHVISDESDPFKHKKSIVDEKISVFLDQSQNKAFLCQKPNTEAQLKHLNKMLHNQTGNVIEILTHQVQKNEIKNEELKKLVCILVEKLTEQCQKTDTSYSSENSFRLSNFIIKPYLQQQISALEKNLGKLKSREQDLLMIKNMGEEKKKFLVNSLKQMDMIQRRELKELAKTGCS